MGDYEQLLETKEVSELTGIKESTLRFWRYLADGTGPKSFTLGRRAVRYRKSDVQKWLDEQYEKASA